MVVSETKPRHGEIRQTACVREGDAYRVTYTMFLDPREIDAVCAAMLLKASEPPQ